jgi:hypothetical protein
MIRHEWSVEQESMDFVYIVYFVTDRFNSSNIQHEGLPRVLHQRYSTTSTTTPPLLLSTWFGMRGFLNYLFGDMCSARGASSFTSATSTSTSDFILGAYCTTSTGLRLGGLHRLPRQHRLSTLSSASTTPTRTRLWLKGLHRLPHQRRLRLRFHQLVLRHTRCTGPGPSSQSPDKRG